MINKRDSHISWITLILYLCLGSVAILPFMQATPSMLETFGVDVENYSLFDQAEFEDDFFVTSIVAATIAKLIFSKSRSTDLDSQPASLFPVFSPPKPA